MRINIHVMFSKKHKLRFHNRADKLVPEYTVQYDDTAHNPVVDEYGRFVPRKHSGSSERKLGNVRGGRDRRYTHALARALVHNASFNEDNTAFRRRNADTVGILGKRSYDYACRLSER